MPDPVLSSLLRINRQRIRRLRQALLPYQYVGIMHLIVLYISKHAGASQEDISAFYALDKASVARDARRLEELGHIRREVDPRNRRRYRLFVTQAGLEMLPVINQFYEDFVRRLSVGIAREEWALLEELLARVEKNICAPLYSQTT